MCIGIPSQVITIKEQMAEVDALGEKRWVSLILMNEEVAIGDYLLIQVGNFAVEKIAPDHAKEALNYLRELAQQELS